MCLGKETGNIYSCMQNAKLSTSRGVRALPPHSTPTPRSTQVLAKYCLDPQRVDRAWAARHQAAQELPALGADAAKVNGEWGGGGQVGG